MAHRTTAGSGGLGLVRPARDPLHTSQQESRCNSGREDNMDFQAILAAVGTVGFPIVACGALFWMVNKTVKELTTAVNNNTTALIKFSERNKTDHEENGN